MNKEQRLRQNIDQLKQQWQLVSEKLSRLREAKTIETDAARTFQLEKQIEPLEIELKTIEEQLDDLENRLSRERETNPDRLQDKTRVQSVSKTGNGTMKSSAELNKEIVEFLTSLPNIHDSSTQRAFIFSAGLDTQLQHQIHFGGPSAQFFQLLVATLVSYGRLEDGRDALEAVLEAAKSSVGQDRQDYCDRLIQEWRKEHKATI